MTLLNAEAAAATNEALRRAVLVVALANLAYGIVEFIVALRIGSVSLFADSIDFFEDSAVNILIFFALAWSSQVRARIGMVLAGILLIPAAAAVWAAAQKLLTPVAPDSFVLGLTGLGALAVNLLCAIFLTKFRSHSGSLTRAAFLSARNDVLANVAIIAAGVVTAYIWLSAWPDLLVGIGIACLNAGAAREVWKAAQNERETAEP